MSPTTSYLVGLLVVFWVAVVLVIFSLISPYSCAALIRWELKISWFDKVRLIR